MAELYEEFVPLFEAADFNVCGDETWDLGKGRSKDACRPASASGGCTWISSARFAASAAATASA